MGRLQYRRGKDKNKETPRSPFRKLNEATLQIRMMTSPSGVCPSVELYRNTSPYVDTTEH